MGSWAAKALDAYLENRRRAGRPIPLAWHRGSFRVVLDGVELPLRGMVSHPFGIFRGNTEGPLNMGCRRFTLVHLPDRRIVATLRTYRQCQALASELAPILPEMLTTGRLRSSATSASKSESERRSAGPPLPPLQSSQARLGLAAERRSHSRLAAPAFLLLSSLWGQHLWGCIIAKRGRKKFSNPVAVQRMVDLWAAGHSRRDAAKKVASGSGKEGISWESLRSHYRELESAGTLPKPSSHIEHTQEAMRQAFKRRRSAIEEAKGKLAAAEEYAKSLGLDLSGELEAKRASLSFKRIDIRDFLSENSDVHMYHFLGEGITDPEEAARRLAELERERELLERQVQALWEVIRLRDLASKEP